MFLGVWFLAKQVSIKVLWWLALAIMIRDAFRRLALASRREGCCGLGSMEERKREREREIINFFCGIKPYYII